MTTEAIAPDRRRPHSIHLHGARTVAQSASEVYRFLTERVPVVYTELARGHERFEVIGGGPVRLGVTIDCRERADNQEVHHLYEVRAATPARHLYYASQPSKTFIHLKRRVITDAGDTHVYWDMSERAGETQLALTIVIQLRHTLQHWLAVATGSTGLWRRHLDEELGNLKTLIEQDVRPARELLSGSAQS